VGRVLASVKGGKNVPPQFARDLLGTLGQHKAEMGVLITMTEPTPGVREVMDHGGTYVHPANRQACPRVQVITIKELLAGKRPKMPPLLLPYIQASRTATTAGTQGTLDEVAELPFDDDLDMDMDDDEASA
jgi:hypothetical protein